MFRCFITSLPGKEFAFRLNYWLADNYPFLPGVTIAKCRLLSEFLNISDISTRSRSGDPASKMPFRWRRKRKNRHLSAAGAFMYPGDRTEKLFRIVGAI